MTMSGARPLPRRSSRPGRRISARICASARSSTTPTTAKPLFRLPLLRQRAALGAFQLNKYLFFRAILEHNSFRRRLTTDLLASFTYIPGTVVHIGYGSLYEKLEWRDGSYEPADRFLETKRGFFFKASYLWRL